MVVYTGKKAQNCKKKSHWEKRVAYSYENIYWCSKGHMRKSDNFTKTLLVIAKLFSIIMWTVRHQEAY